MTVSQTDKARKLRALHEAPGAFVIPNPWDAGSARVLEGLGFEALATSSGAKAGVLGRRDGKVSREEGIANARLIAGAVDIPVIGDLEKGYGDTPEDAAETIRQAAAAGLVGGSIEDATGNPAAPLFDIEAQVARVKAASQAAKALPFAFVLTARAEGFLRGKPDLDDVIRRLQAFEAAGADVLFAPGLPDLAAVKKVTGSLKKPFNFMVGIKGKSFSRSELEAAGVKRISLATSLYRAAMTGLLEAAKEVKDKGTFTYLDRSIPTPELNAFMKE
ncbi:MAG: isocitrate lyase/phosphoenolpyruvate mutase family protein [Enhydrobacter sp.]|nr:MAG: isocitrate lyase/phosphoenolpyruvate mutase family protein [Enhydrobacter sp.]